MQTVIVKGTFLDIEELDAAELEQPPALRSQTTSDLRRYRDDEAVYVDDGSGWRKTTPEDMPRRSRRGRCLTELSEGSTDGCATGRSRERSPAEGAAVMPNGGLCFQDGGKMGGTTTGSTVDSAPTRRARMASLDFGGQAGGADALWEGVGDETRSEAASEDDGGSATEDEGEAGAHRGAVLRRRHGPNQRAKRTEKRRLKRQAERAAARAARAAAAEAPLAQPMPIFAVVAPQGGGPEAKVDGGSAVPPASMRPALMVAAMAHANGTGGGPAAPMLPAGCLSPAWAPGYGQCFGTPVSQSQDYGTPATPCGTSDSPTTVMMRNIPNNYTRSMLVDLLDAEGLAGRYDFVYLPHDFKTHAGLGFAFVNLHTTADAECVHQRFEGFKRWAVPSAKVCTVGWSSPDQQGLAANVKRYRNSSVMHESVPEECKPLILDQGVPVPFPRNTRRLWPPHAGYGARARGGDPAHA